MGKVYLNDIDVDLFMKYFNSTNYSGIENSLSFVELKVKDSPKYKVSFNRNDDSTTTIYGNNESDLLWLGNVESVSGLDYSDKSILNIPNITETTLLNGFEIQSNLNIFKEIKFDTKYVYMEDECILYSLSTNVLDNTGTLSLLNVGSVNDSLKNLTIDTDANEKLIERIKNKETFEFTKTDNFIIESTPGFSFTSYIIGIINPDSSSSNFIERYNLFLLVLPEIYKIPETDSNGNYLYIDEYNRKSTQQYIPNNFYKHQNLIRKIYNQLTEDINWESEVEENTMVILKRGNEHIPAVYFKRPITTSYSYSSSYEGQLSPRYLPKNILTENKLTESITSDEKFQVLLNPIESYPKLTAILGYDENIKDLNFKFRNIVETIDKSTLDSRYEGAPFLVDCYNMYATINNKSHNIDKNGCIEISVGYGQNKNFSVGNLEKRKFTVMDAHTIHPNIVIPIVSLKEDDEQTTLDSLNKLKSKIRYIQVDGVVCELITKVNIENISGISVLINGKNYPLMIADEIGFNNKLVKQAMNIPDNADVFFFEFPLEKVEKRKIYTVICSLNENEELNETVAPISKTKITELENKGTKYVLEMVDMDTVGSSTQSYTNNNSSPVIRTGNYVGSKSTISGIPGGIVSVPPSIKNNPTLIKNSSGVKPGSSTIKNKGSTAPYIKKSEDTVVVNTNSNTSILNGLFINSKDRDTKSINMNTLSLGDDDDTTVEKVVKELLLTPAEWVINYSTDVDEWEEIEYFRNQYATSNENMYIKKVVSYGKIDVSEKQLVNDIILYSNDSEYNKLENIFNKFISEKRYFQTNTSILRGEYIPDNRFLNSRKESIKNSLKDILSNENLGHINLLEEYYKTDGRDRLYNYCKGIINLAKKDSNRAEPELNSTVIRDNVSNKILLKSLKDRLLISFNKYNDIIKKPDKVLSLKSGLSRNRTFIEKMNERRIFPNQAAYDAYISIISESEQLLDIFNIKEEKNNVNMKWYSKMSKDYKPAFRQDNNTDREVYAGALEKFYSTGNALYLSNPPKNIRETYFPESDFSYEEVNEKKIYTYEMLNNETLKEIISDLIIVKNDLVGEVINEPRNK